MRRIWSIMEITTNAALQGYRVTGLQGYRVTGLQGYQRLNCGSYSGNQHDQVIDAQKQPDN